MRTEEIKQVLRLRLLALVLALALTWYAVNPAPSPVRPGGRRDEGRPEGERREATPRVDGGAASGVAGKVRSGARPESTGHEDLSADELDWPECIDLD